LDVVGILIGLAVIIGIPVAALVALARTATLQREMMALRREVALLRQAAQGTAPAPTAAPVSAAPPISAPPVSAPPISAPAPVMAAPEPAVPPPEPAAPIPPPQPAAPPKPRPAPAEKKSAEGQLTSRWMVWIGGLALALGGVFLVKYSIEAGYLGPLVRVALGIAAGLAMLAAGEAARRHPSRRPSSLRLAQADTIPAVITGAGFLTLFASVYSAHALYGLLPSAAAFAVLALVGLGAIAVSLLHGQAMALFGLIGAMIVPLLVTSETPLALVLFGYLAIVTGALAAIARLRHWWAVLAAAIAGAALWVVLWLAGQAPPQPWVLGPFLLLLAVLPLWTLWPAAEPERAPGALSLSIPDYVVAASGAVVALLCLLLVRCDLYSTLSLATLGAVSLLFLAAAWRIPAWHALPAAAAVAVLAVLALWHVPVLFNPYEGADAEIAALNPVVSPAFARFTGIAAAFAILFGAAGFAALGRGRRMGYWAGLSAAVPVLILFIAYWRWTGFRSDAGWAAIAVALAALATFAAERQRMSRPALGAYAAGAVAALSLALAMILREAWLTAALSLQLPALAWIARRLDLPVLRAVAAALAAVVLVRLLANPALVEYPAGGWFILNWVLYGYGVPALAFWTAARLLLTQRDGLTVTLLEAGAAAFVTCLVSLQIRVIFSGGMAAPYDSLLEASLQSAAWLGMGYALYARQGLRARPALNAASMVLRAAGAAHLLLVQVLYLNPLWTNAPVGTMPVLNTLALAYLLPAGFAGLYAWSAARRGETLMFRIAGIAALLLALLWLSLEVRHLFQGPYLNGPGVTNAENYTYSAVWMLYGAALFAAGLRWRSQALRLASLAIFMLTAAKVFLLDTSNLSGMLRALSFLGLGGALLAVAYLSQRLVQRPAAGADPE
jgi:uncharacterized membrane protein